jgi:hypothetical protein
MAEGFLQNLLRTFHTSSHGHFRAHSSVTYGLVCRRSKQRPHLDQIFDLEFRGSE